MVWGGADPNQLAVAPLMARFGVFRLGLIPTPKSDPDLPPQQYAELQAYLNTAKYLETLRTLNLAFPSTLAQVRALGKLGAMPLAVVVGTADENASGDLFALQEDLAALSTNSTLRKVDGATHAGLVDKREYAMQTSAIILEVVEAARTGQAVRQ